MTKTTLLLACLALAAGTALAQDAVQETVPQAAPSPAPCPHLDAASGLSWTHLAGPDYDFCRALAPDGTQVLGVFVGADSPFEPRRANAAERGVVDGREVTWYASELAGDPDAQVRETLLVLPDGREAHIWLRADNTGELASKLELAQGLGFDPVMLSGN